MKESVFHNKQNEKIKGDSKNGFAGFAPGREARSQPGVTVAGGSRVPLCTTRVWILRRLCESIRWQYARCLFSGLATHQSSHDHSTTVRQRRSTTLPSELTNDQRDMSAAGYKNAQNTLHWEETGKKTHHIAETVQHETWLHLSIDGCQHLRRDMLIFSVSFQEHWLRQGRVKRRQQKYRDAQSHVFSRCPPLSTRQQQ